MIRHIKKQFKRVIAHPHVSRWILWFLLAGLTFLFALLFTPKPTPQFSTLETGEKVWEDIRSDYDFTVTDVATTNQRKKEVSDSVLPIYDYDSRIQAKLDQRITDIFNDWRQRMRERRLQVVAIADPDFVGPPIPPEVEITIENDQIIDFDQDYRDFLASSGLKISAETFRLMRDLEFKYIVEEPIHAAVSHICSFTIVGSRERLFENAKAGLIRRDMFTSDERVIHNLDTITSLNEIYREVDNSASRLLPDNQLLQDITAEVTRSLVRPNLTFNMQETEKRKIAAQEAVKPVFFQVAAGEIIISAGERVTPEIKLRLDQLNKLGKESRLGLIFVGNFLLMSLIVSLVVFTLRKFHSEIGTNRAILIGLIAAIELLLCKGFIKLAAVIPEYMSSYPFDSPNVYRYAVPFAFGTMLIALLVNERTGVFFSFIVGIMTSLLFDNDFIMGIYAVLSSYAAVFAITHYKHRTMILQGGFMVSLANIVTVLVLQLIHGEIDGMVLVLTGLMGLIGGLLVAMIVTILLPILEWLFKIPTDIRLLELSNFNEPLLRKLAMDAPGTHHHSLMVGDLAEAAAEAIGANALLAKVGAYYHDIGKIAQPNYFIENIQSGNPHDKLTPNMSSMIIRNHVKQGVEMAVNAGLGSDIIEIIQQHHGDSMLAFFYNKACENAREGNQNLILEDGFRYSGPCPRSKEAAIVLIADSIEAAARSMKSPSPATLKTMVQKVTSAKFQDHQFDDCELTFRELTIIAESLYDRLLRNNHTRIAYPGFDFSQKTVKESIADKSIDDSGNEN